MASEKKVYLICSVRKAEEHEKKIADRYVRRLESLGYEVHYPPRDVDQNDPTGMRIIDAHVSAMKWCTEVIGVWNPKSEGSGADLTMARFAGKPFHLANKRRIEDWLKDHEGKSYTNAANEYDKDYRV